MVFPVARSAPDRAKENSPSCPSPPARRRPTTFSVGPGVFYELRLWRGLFLQPSLRWWPNVASTLPEGATLLGADQKRVKMESHSFGIFPNVSLGWNF